MKEMFAKIWSYLTFQKQTEHPKASSNFNLRAMHTINKISILLFILAGIFLFFKWFVF